MAVRPETRGGGEGGAVERELVIYKGEGSGTWGWKNRWSENRRDQNNEVTTKEHQANWNQQKHLSVALQWRQMFLPTALLLPHTVGLLDVMHHSGSASWELPINSKPEKIHWQVHSTYTAKKNNNNKKYRNEHWSNAGEILRPCSKIVLIDNKLNNFNAT